MIDLVAAKRIWALENASSDNIFFSFMWSCYMQHHRSYNEEAVERGEGDGTASSLFNFWLRACLW